MNAFVLSSVGPARLVASAVAVWLSANAGAQDYTLASGRITAGGGQSAGGTFVLRGSIAQPDAGRLAGTTYAAIGGFWNLMTLPTLVSSGADAFEFQAGRTMKIPVASLTGNDASVLGYPLAVAAVDATTEQGGTLRQAGGWLIYTPPSGGAAEDRFHYTITDGGAGPRHAVVGTVELRAAGATVGERPPNAARIAVDAGNVRLTFIGVPGRSYRVQYAVETTPSPVWLEFAPEALVTAGGNGIFEYVDVAPPEANRIYRAVSATAQ